MNRNFINVKHMEKFPKKPRRYTNLRSKLCNTSSESCVTGKKKEHFG